MIYKSLYVSLGAGNSQIYMVGSPCGSRSFPAMDEEKQLAADFAAVEGIFQMWFQDVQKL